MKTRISLTIILLMSLTECFSQFIDNYGVSTGLTYTNQLWYYSNSGTLNGSRNRGYKPGLEIFAMAEKELNRTFLVRSELGYLQKGFKNNVSLTSANGQIISYDHQNVLLNDVALDLKVKYKPFEFRVIPYAVAGFRGDYTISYRDINYSVAGSAGEYSLYGTVLHDMNRFNFGGLIGAGIILNNRIWFEACYNPSFTRSLKTSTLKIRDNCWELRVGFNINRI